MAKKLRVIAILQATLLLALLGGCGRLGCGRRPGAGPPYRPEDALKTFQLAKGFRIELFAAEPLVTSPVAMEFDEYGRIFVVEMPGYPLDTSGTGRVKWLEDTDNDGRPDRSIIVADKLVLPTGLMRWKKGLLVTDPPNVWYLEDIDGGHPVDKRRAMLTGFAFTNPQHTANGLVYGLDNWIYMANEPPVTAVVFKEKFGDRGSAIRFPDRADIPALAAGGRNVRFRPDTYQLESLSGSSQFGHTFDEWGHRFTLNNSIHVRHEVIAARYLNRNPHLLVSSAMRDMSDHGNAAEIFPITRHPLHQMLTDVGRITSACGLTLYLGGAFPSGFDRTSFVAELAHNLVHCDVWSESGSTFVARRADERSEFLASTDSWFRPVNFYIGPDGALYVLDFYRQIIEHPEWMAREVYESKAIYSGVDRGRIYRIVPDSAATLPRPRNIQLGKASDEELVRQLENPNIWWRRTAQRLLVDRRSAAAMAPLITLFKTSRSAAARLHALWTLEGLGKLPTPLIESALEDPAPGVRENAIQLAEARLATTPALVEKLLRRVGDPHPRVRFQLFCTLGDLTSDAAQAARAQLLFENIEDEWMQVAALSVPSVPAMRWFERAAAQWAVKPTDGRAHFFRQVASMIGAESSGKDIDRVIEIIAEASPDESTWWRSASLAGLTAGMSGRKAEPPKIGEGGSLLLSLLHSPDTSLRRSALRLLEAIGLPTGSSLAAALTRAASRATDPQVDPEERADALRLLSIVGPAPNVDLLKPLTDSQQPEAVRAAAVRALGRVHGEEIGRFLLSQWRTMTPRVRAEAIDTFLADPSRLHLFLQALQNDQVQSWMLSARHQRQLIMHRDADVRASARTLLAKKAADRRPVIKRYEAALQIDGDAARGASLFNALCAKCHQMNGVGGKLGPDLATVRNRTPEALLQDILIPSQSIAQNYETYVVEWVGGGLIDGIVGAETPTTITLRRMDGTEETVARQNIKQMYVSNLSAMPEDLDKQISVPQMADLLKFLKTAR